MIITPKLHECPDCETVRAALEKQFAQDAADLLEKDSSLRGWRGLFAFNQPMCANGRLGVETYVLFTIRADELPFSDKPAF